MSNTETIADTALKGTTDKVDKNKEEKKADKPAKKYIPGMYRADKFMRIIKELSFTHVKDANGTIQKTHGTWAKDKNMIIFKKGVETELTADDLKLPAIQRLIDSKIIYRMG